MSLSEFDKFDGRQDADPPDELRAEDAPESIEEEDTPSSPPPQRKSSWGQIWQKLGQYWRGTRTAQVARAEGIKQPIPYATLASREQSIIHPWGDVEYTKVCLRCDGLVVLVLQEGKLTTGLRISCKCERPAVVFLPKDHYSPA